MMVDTEKALDPVEENEDTAFYLEADTFDPCGGHSTPTGSYHYYGTAGGVPARTGGGGCGRALSAAWLVIRKSMLMFSLFSHQASRGR